MFTEKRTKVPVKDPASIHANRFSSSLAGHHFLYLLLVYFCYSMSVTENQKHLHYYVREGSQFSRPPSSWRLSSGFLASQRCLASHPKTLLRFLTFKMTVKVLSRPSHHLGWGKWTCSCHLKGDCKMAKICRIASANLAASRFLYRPPGASQGTLQVTS